MAFLGQMASGIHLSLLLVNFATISLVCVLGRQLFGIVTGLVTAATWRLLSISASILGLAAHPTQFIIALAAVGGLVVLRALNRENSWFFPFS